MLGLYCTTTQLPPFGSVSCRDWKHATNRAQPLTKRVLIHQSCSFRPPPKTPPSFSWGTQQGYQIMFLVGKFATVNDDCCLVRKKVDSHHWTGLVKESCMNYVTSSFLVCTNGPGQSNKFQTRPIEVYLVATQLLLQHSLQIFRNWTYLATSSFSALNIE